MEAQDDISFGFEVLHLDGDRAFVTGGPPTCELGTGSGSALDVGETPIGENAFLSLFDPGPARRVRIGEVAMATEPGPLSTGHGSDEGFGVLDEREEKGNVLTLGVRGIVDGDRAHFDQESSEEVRSVHGASLRSAPDGHPLAPSQGLRSARDFHGTGPSDGADRRTLADPVGGQDVELNGPCLER